MERATPLHNLWLIVQTLGWVLALDGVADFFSDRHSHALFRGLIYLFLDRDPARPRVPDSWEEWYNS